MSTQIQGDPVVKELQILQPKMAEMKHTIGHDYYKVIRKLFGLGEDISEIPEINAFRSLINDRMDYIYTAAFRLDNPSFVLPIEAQNKISSFDSGIEVFSNSSSEVLRILRSPESTNLRTSVISSGVGTLADEIESFAIKHSPDISIIRQMAGDKFGVIEDCRKLL